MREIPLHSRKYPGLVALVDDADYELVSRYRWNVFAVQGRPWYAHTQVRFSPGPRGRTWISMHKMLTGWSRVDHRDGSGFNNQRYNLREATVRQNAWNQGKSPRPGLSSKYKGVHWDRRKRRWRARITVNGKSMSRGTFAIEEDAARAVDTAARTYCGEFARLNLP